MKTCILAAALAVSCTQPAIGRIGETMEECRQRYGGPVEDLRDAFMFRKNNVEILAYFNQGKACALMFAKGGFVGESASQEFSAEERRLLMELNGGDSTWILRSNNEWVTVDKQRAATLKDGILCISNMDFIQDAESRQKTRAAVNLSGF